MTNDLAPLQNSTPSAPTSIVLSPPLKRLLEAEPKGDVAFALIVADAGMLAETKAALPAIMDRLNPGDERSIRDVIGRRFGTFPQPERDDAEWVAFWSDYYDTLGDLPADAVELGMRAWVRSAKAEFLPKPGKLRELTLEAARPLYTAAARARRIAAYAPPTEAADDLTVEERKALVADALKGIGGKSV